MYANAENRIKSLVKKKHTLMSSSIKINKNN